MKRTTDSDVKIRKIIAEHIWSELSDQGITQKDLANQIGVSDATISNILYEKSTPSITVMASIANALYVSIDYLCGISDER